MEQEAACAALKTFIVHRAAGNNARLADGTTDCANPEISFTRYIPPTRGGLISNFHVAHPGSRLESKKQPPYAKILCRTKTNNMTRQLRHGGRRLRPWGMERNPHLKCLRSRRRSGISGVRPPDKRYQLVELTAAAAISLCGRLWPTCSRAEHNDCDLGSLMTRRFDRLAGGGKLHMQSLCALAHFDFNQAGAHSYEQAMLAIRQLDLPMEAVEEQFRRMTFNIIARNQDDHVKNIAFLMDKAGRWSLSPAFDVTYSYNPDGTWTATHQMTMNGKRDEFTLADFRSCAKSALMKRGRAETIIEEVRSAVARWPNYAHQAQVTSDRARQIKRTHRLEFPRK